MASSIPSTLYDNLLVSDKAAVRRAILVLSKSAKKYNHSLLLPASSAALSVPDTRFQMWKILDDAYPKELWMSFENILSGDESEDLKRRVKDAIDKYDGILSTEVKFLQQYSAMETLIDKLLLNSEQQNDNGELRESHLMLCIQFRSTLEAMNIILDADCSRLFNANYFIESTKKLLDETNVTILLNIDGFNSMDELAFNIGVYTVTMSNLKLLIRRKRLLHHNCCQNLIATSKVSKEKK